MFNRAMKWCLLLSLPVLWNATTASALVAAETGGSTSQKKLAEPPLEIPNPTPLESLGRQAQVASISASTAASDARAVTAESEARLNAEAAARSRRAAQVAAAEAEMKSLKIKGAVKEAEKQQAGAASAAQEAKAALLAAKAAVVMAEKDASTEVRKTIDGRLSSTLMDLQDWKMKVLHDPTQEATRAGVKAALPFERALQTIEKRVSDFETRATGLSNQARGLRTAAVGLANAAVEKQAGGAIQVAQNDMMNAHTMMAQAAGFEAQGLKLLAQAQMWNVQIPTYVGAAASAAHKRTWEYGKKLFAPPPITFGAAPPTEVLLQEEGHLRRESLPEHTP